MNQWICYCVRYFAVKTHPCGAREGLLRLIESGKNGRETILCNPEQSRRLA